MQYWRDNGRVAGGATAPVMFAGSRRFAEEWAYRFLGAAAGDVEVSPEPEDGSSE